MQQQPDLSARPFHLEVERDMKESAATLYRAFTTGLDSWFAAPGTLTMTPEVGALFFFETHFEGQRHPHYGRFLRLVPNRLIEMTWVTGNPGTLGAETVVTIELESQDGGTHFKLAHAGFADADSKDGHLKAWPQVLDHLVQNIAQDD